MTTTHRTVPFFKSRWPKLLASAALIAMFSVGCSSVRTSGGGASGAYVSTARYADSAIGHERDASTNRAMDRSSMRSETRPVRAAVHLPPPCPSPHR